MADLRNIFFSSTDDYVCRFSSTGLVTCKAAYNHIRVHMPKVSWSREVWRHYLPPTHSFLTWRILHRKIPTVDVLQAKGLQMVSRCSLCCVAEDSLDHIFSKCSYAKTLWLALCSLFEVSLDFSSGFVNLFKSAMRLHFSSQILVLWCVGVHTAIWSIWQARNKFIFKDVQISISASVCFVCQSIKEAEIFKSGHMQNSFVDHRILQRLRVSGIP